MKYRNQAIMAATGGSLFAVSSGAFAAIQASDLDAPLTAITTDANTVFTAVLPVMLTVLGLVIGYKLVKRFVNGI